MSQIAPWLALSIDWQDSEMFDDATHGVRLAWICLLCFAKAQGRAGRVRLRGKKFAGDYRLSVESVNEMLACASVAGAVRVDGDSITVVNWKSYQDPKARNSTTTKHKSGKDLTSKRRSFSKSAENDATQHPPPSTPNPVPRTSSASAFVRPTLAEVEAYCVERGKGVNPQKWFDHYTSNGWKVGKNAMKDWKAAIRKWEDSEYGNSTTARGRNPNHTGRYRGTN